jgi:O-phosphoseryl-tRNA(Cys) synthetase
MENSTKVYYLSDEEKKLVNEGLEAYKRGDVISGDDADREIDEWLKK